MMIVSTASLQELIVHIILVSFVAAWKEEPLHYVADNIPGGSYKYYSLMYDGLIKIQLTSEIGDADLYVSQTISKPTYDPNCYCLQSSTCGEDIIYIPQSFKRPVSIGVYGHPFHDITKYILLVCNITRTSHYSYDSVAENVPVDHEYNFIVVHCGFAVARLFLTIDKRTDEKIQVMLEYENQMLLEVLEEDGLVIAAKGLGLESVVANILKIYLDPGNLVIVLGTTDYDEKYLLEKLKKSGSKHLPRVVTAQCTSNEREIMYLEGGVLFISGRIFVVDLLKERVPLKLITGILVYRAHTILNSYQETFALRLYRRSNKTGFIKAFSNSALAFTTGFAQVERVMRVLFVKRLYLWPRFHTLVNSSLSKRKPEVVELHVKITPKMLGIQTALLDIMNHIIKDMRRINKYLDLEELTVENAISRKFHKQLQLELDPVWHQLSSTSKQLVADLKTLRTFLTCLTYEDSVSFYAMLNRLRTMAYAMKTSGWLMLDPVENLFKYAKARVYTDENELQPEANPKWAALTQVLIEIQRERTGNERDPKKVLLLVYDSKACRQLKDCFVMGANEFLLSEASKKLDSERTKKKSPNLEQQRQVAGSTETDVSEETEETEETEGNTGSYVLTLSQNLSLIDPAVPAQQDSKQLTFEECSQIGELDIAGPLPNAPLIIIQSLKKDGDPMALQRALEEHLPMYVILYVTDISAVRQLEIYQNNNPSVNLKVYFLIYGGSVEEQEYLTSLRREKEAFHKLIMTKTTMVIPENQDGRNSDSLGFASELAEDSDRTENSRKCGGQASENQGKERIIVDMREFRSELPALLHKRGIEIDPVTLVVGDYILSSEICVERKSISDLIGSLNSGRLYNQATAMTRHYSKPMLLIEFDQNKPFSLHGNYYVSKDIKSTDVTAKLQLLTLHFPKLKLVWSPNPHATAQLFEELKQGGDQPDAVKAAQVGVDVGAAEDKALAEKYSARIQDFIAKLPGVHTKNLRVILKKGCSLDHLAKLTKEELSDMIGNGTDAKMLHNALHDKCWRTDDTSANPLGRHTSKWRGKKLFSKLKHK